LVGKTLYLYVTINYEYKEELSIYTIISESTISSIIYKKKEYYSNISHDYNTLIQKQFFI